LPLSEALFLAQNVPQTVWRLSRALSGPAVEAYSAFTDPLRVWSPREGEREDGTLRGGERGTGGERNNSEESRK